MERIRCPNPKCGRHILDIEEIPRGARGLAAWLRRCSSISSSWWGGSHGNEYRHMYLLTPYLATINNLSSAVVKDANKTMKITYTLTEEA